MSDLIFIMCSRKQFKAIFRIKLQSNHLDQSENNFHWECVAINMKVNLIETFTFLCLVSIHSYLWFFAEKKNICSFVTQPLWIWLHCNHPSAPICISYITHMWSIWCTKIQFRHCHKVILHVFAWYTWQIPTNTEIPSKLYQFAVRNNSTQNSAPSHLWLWLLLFFILLSSVYTYEASKRAKSRHPKQNSRCMKYNYSFHA